METTIKGNVKTTIQDGIMEVSYKRRSLLLSILSMISLGISVPLCFLLIGFALLPGAFILLGLFYFITVKDKFHIQPGKGLILKKHTIAYKDITSFEMTVKQGIGVVSALVNGKSVVIANLLTEPVARELYALVTSDSQ